MTAGLIVYNDFDTVLIDDKARNLALKNKTARTTATGWTMGADEYLPAGGGPSRYGCGGVETLCTFPVVAMKPHDAQWARITNNTMAHTGDPLYDEYFFYNATSYVNNVDIDFFIFDVPVLPAGSNGFGLQVFNSAGVLCFDSRLKYAIVRDILTINAGNGYAATATYESGRAYAIATPHVDFKVDGAQVWVQGSAAANVQSQVVIYDVTSF